ncbi:MAG: hypothetical protein IT328_27885 [Caldilineaceae bacterium]|nr:hypothetical protein [Caldilineaceae bacterium]
MTQYTKRDNFVAPAPRQHVEIVPIGEQLPMLPTAQTSVTLHTTYTDRSVGFQVATVPISIAFGVGALVVAVVGYSVPVLSIGALMVFWLAFLGWWLLGWAIHHIASPDGIALVQAILMYRYVRNEQRERLRRYASLRAKDGADHE